MTFIIHLTHPSYHRLAKSKSHIVYNDATLNSAHAVHLNAYQNFTVLAMKMHHYLRQWGLDVPKHHAFVLSAPSSPFASAEYVVLIVWPRVFPAETIRQAIRFAYTSACNKATHKLARTHAARIDLQERQAAWCVRFDSPFRSHSWSVAL